MHIKIRNKPLKTHENNLTLTHTHTHLTALCPGLPGRAGIRKVKPIWILLKQKRQWHQLGHMQVSTSLQSPDR